MCFESEARGSRRNKQPSPAAVRLSDKWTKCSTKPTTHEMGCWSRFNLPLLSSAEGTRRLTSKAQKASAHRPLCTLSRTWSCTRSTTLHSQVDWSRTLPRPTRPESKLHQQTLRLLERHLYRLSQPSTLLSQEAELPQPTLRRLSRRHWSCHSLRAQRTQLHPKTLWAPRSAPWWARDGTVLDHLKDLFLQVHDLFPVLLVLIRSEEGPRLGPCPCTLVAAGLQHIMPKRQGSTDIVGQRKQPPTSTTGSSVHSTLHSSNLERTWRGSKSRHQRTWWACRPDSPTLPLFPRSIPSWHRPFAPVDTAPDVPRPATCSTAERCDEGRRRVGVDGWVEPDVQVRSDTNQRKCLLDASTH